MIQLSINLIVKAKITIDKRFQSVNLHHRQGWGEVLWYLYLSSFKYI